MIPNADGVYHASLIIKDHLNKMNDQECSCRGLIYSRLTLPAQLSIVFIDTLVTQTLRGLTYTLVGAFNKKLRQEGIKDLLAVAIQAIALPVIICTCFFSIKGAAKLSELGKSSDFTLKESRSDYAVALVLKILAIPLSCLRAALQIPISLLSIDLHAAATNTIHVVVEPLFWLATLFITLPKQKFNDTATNVFEGAHACYIGKKTICWIPHVHILKPIS